MTCAACVKWAIRAAAPLVCLGMLASTAAADSVVLHSGRSLSGDVVEDNDRVVVLEIKGMGKVTFDRRDVKEVRRSGSATPASGVKDPPLRADPPPPAREVPTTDPSASPSGKDTHSSGGGVGRVEARLKERVKFSVSDGLLSEVLDRLSRETGLEIRLTEEGRRLLSGSEARVKPYTSEAPIGELLQRLLNNVRGSGIEFRVTSDGVLIGRDHEVFGAMATLGGASVEWEDARGDTERSMSAKDWVVPDLVRLSLASEAGDLVITLHFAADVERTLDQLTPEGEQKGYELATVYLDLDGDDHNGESISWDEMRKGWECHVDVSTGFELRMIDSGTTFAQWGNISTIAGDHEVLRNLTRYTIWKAGQTSVLTVDDPTGKPGPTPDELNTLDGHTVIARIPYARLGLESGRRIRACFVDNLQEMLSRGRISQDATLTLD